MNADMRRFLVVTYEFVITLVVLLGGGYIEVFGHIDQTTATSIVGFISFVLGFWFTQRGADRGGKNGGSGSGNSGT